jgi:hypothetical protein
MKADTILGGALFVAFALFLKQRNLMNLLAWVALIALIGNRLGDLSLTVSVITGIVGVYIVSMISVRENFEEKEEKEEVEKKTTPTPAPPKTSDPHVDIGTTILHAYRNLTPEQLGGMRRDTRELMELQKELMGSLGEMKPAIEQGAELLRTFSTFFGQQA